MSPKRRHYNDVIRMVPYKAAHLHLDGRRRKGIHEPIGRRRDRVRRVRCSLKENSPLSLDTPMHSETLSAIEVIRSTPDEQIRTIWDVQLRAAEEFARKCAMDQTKWNARIPGPIAAAGGMFRNVAAAQLFHQLNIAWSSRVGQFAYGSPITGTMARKYLFPIIEKLRFRLPAHEISGSPPTRFLEDRINLAGRMIRCI